MFEGKDLAEALGAHYAPDERWVTSEIETLSNGNSEALGTMWQECQKSPVIVENFNFCKIIKYASQIISLRLNDLNTSSHELIVEDGVIVSIRGIKISKTKKV